MSAHDINFIAIIFHSLPLQVFLRERTPACNSASAQYIQESELRCPREEGPKSDGDRSVRGTSIGFNLGFNRGVAVSMRPDRAFSFRRTMPGGRLSGCPAAAGWSIVG